MVMHDYASFTGKDVPGRAAYVLWCMPFCIGDLLLAGFCWQSAESS